MVRLRIPIRPQGARAVRWSRWHSKSRAVVAARSGGCCEVCGRDGLRLEWHHTAQRQNILGEPWASCPELCAAVCPPDHRLITAGQMPEAAELLRSVAARRLAESFDVTDCLEQLIKSGYGGLDCIRSLVHLLEEQGWCWSDSTQSIRFQTP